MNKINPQEVNSQRPVSEQDLISKSQKSKGSFKGWKLSFLSNTIKKMQGFLKRPVFTKTFTKKSWSVATNKPAQGAKTQPKRNTLQTRTMVFNRCKNAINNTKTSAGADQIEKKIGEFKSRSLLAPRQAEELTSLVALKRLELGADNHQISLFDTMKSEATAINSLEKAAQFHSKIISCRISGDINESQRMILQGKLTLQLRTMAKNDENQAKRMTMDVLKKLTGDYNTAKTVMTLVKKTVGYEPHINTMGLDERLANLKKK